METFYCKWGLDIKREKTKKGLFGELLFLTVKKDICYWEKKRRWKKSKCVKDIKTEELELLKTN